MYFKTIAFSYREPSPLKARLKLKAIIVHKYHHINYELYLIYNAINEIFRTPNGNK